MLRSMRIVRTLAVLLPLLPLIVWATGGPLCAADRAHASGHAHAQATAALAHAQGGHHDQDAPASQPGHSHDHFGHEHPGSSESIPGPEDRPCSCARADVFGAPTEAPPSRNVQALVLYASATDPPVVPGTREGSGWSLSFDRLNSPYLSQNPPLLI